MCQMSPGSFGCCSKELNQEGKQGQKVALERKGRVSGQKTSYISET